MQRLLIITLVSAITLIPVGFSNADILIDGTTSGTNLGNGVLANGIFTGGPYSASDFSNEFMKWETSEATKTTTNAKAVTLSELDLIDISGTQYLRLVLDIQESGNQEQVTITDLQINVYDELNTDFDNPNLIWDFTNTGTNNIVINKTGTLPANETVDPRGAKADVEFLIPRSVFIGTGFVGADKLKVTVSGLNDRSNGAEEFKLYTGAGGVYLGAGDLVGVPEPGTAILFVAAFGIMLRRRRNGS